MVDREGGIPPWLVAGLVALVVVIGALAYYAGRFKRDDGKPPVATVALPEPGPPSPDVPEAVPTPGDTPPTVTPSAAVLIEKTSRTSSQPMVERSSQVVVPVGSERIPTARIVVEIPPSPRPSPTPTVPELEQAPREAPHPEVTLVPPPPPAPPPPATPEPPAFPPTPGFSAAGGCSTFAA